MAPAPFTVSPGVWVSHEALSTPPGPDDAHGLVPAPVDFGFGAVVVAVVLAAVVVVDAPAAAAVVDVVDEVVDELVLCVFLAAVGDDDPHAATATARALSATTDTHHRGVVLALRGPVA